jgi:hypothetical protein
MSDIAGNDRPRIENSIGYDNMAASVFFMGLENGFTDSRALESGLRCRSTGVWT